MAARWVRAVLHWLAGQGASKISIMMIEGTRKLRTGSRRSLAAARAVHKDSYKTRT